MKNKEKEGTLYAVYGTLRKTGSNHRLLDNEDKVDFIGRVDSDPVYTLKSVLDNFPALLKKGNTSVVMEIYDIKCKGVESKLDQLEGYSADREEDQNYYQKDIINTPLGPAFIYFWNQNNKQGLKNIESGDWIDYILTAKTRHDK